MPVAADVWFPFRLFCSPQPFGSGSGCSGQSSRRSPLIPALPQVPENTDRWAVAVEGLWARLGSVTDPWSPPR